MPIVQSRRRLLTNAAAFAWAAGLAGVGAAGLGDEEKSFAAEPLPETREIRFENIPIFCEAPRYIAEELCVPRDLRSGTSNSRRGGV